VDGKKNVNKHKRNLKEDENAEMWLIKG